MHPDVECSLSDDGAFDSNYRSQYEVWNDAPAGNERSESDLAVTRVIEVSTAGDVDLELLCRERSGGQRVLVVSRIVAQFVPG